MAETIAIAKSFLPKIAGGNLINFVTWMIIIVILAVMGIVLLIFIIYRLKFDKKIIIWEEIGSQAEPSRKDRATELKISRAGDSVFYLRKHKKWLPIPSYQVGKKTYHYYIRSDGEWINMKFANFDAQAKEMGAVFLDKEMRYARTQIQAGLKERYEKSGFMQKYGLFIFSIIYIVIIGIMIWFLFDKWVDTASITNTAIGTANEVLEKADGIIGKLDNLCTGGSGFQPAG